MILVNIGLDGLVESVDANANTRFSYNVNEMVVLSPISPSASATVTFKRQGDVIPLQSHAMTPSAYSDSVSMKTTPCWSYTLQAEELAYKGDVEFTIVFFNGTTQLSSSIGKFYVYNSLAYKTAADVDFTTEVMQLVNSIAEAVLPMNFDTVEQLSIVDLDAQAFFDRTVTPVLLPEVDGIARYKYVDSIKLALPRGRDAVILWGINGPSNISTIEWEEV